MKVPSLGIRVLLGLVAGFWQPAAGADAAQRIVTAGGALTEIVYALGLGDRLVGVDATSLFPPDATKRQSIGYLRGLAAEGVLALRPDLLLAAPEAGPPVALDQIRAAGVRVETINAPNTPDGVRQKLEAVATALDRPDQGAALGRDFQARWLAVKSAVAAYQDHPRVLFVLAHTGGSPMVAGRNTAAEAVISLAGGANAGAGFEGYKPMTGEALTIANPEVLLITTQGVEALGGMTALWEGAALRQTLAGRARRVVVMDALYLLGFGPRLPEAVSELARRLREPEAG